MTGLPTRPVALMPGHHQHHAGGGPHGQQSADRPQVSPGRNPYGEEPLSPDGKRSVKIFFVAGIIFKIKTHFKIAKNGILIIVQKCFCFDGMQKYVTLKKKFNCIF
jgi:hypothetical protein